MKRSRDSYNSKIMDDFNPARKIKSESLGIGDNSKDKNGYLNMDNAKNKVWLVKVPKFLFDKWNDDTKNGIDCGKLKIKKV